MDNLSKKRVSRRRFLTLSSQLILGSAASTLLLLPRFSLGNSPPQQDEAGHQTLMELAYTLFPHPSLPREIYAGVADSIARQIKQSAATGKLVNNGISMLDKNAGKGGWVAQTQERRLDLLKEIESTPFFGFIRNSAIDVIYRDPRVWKQVGYGGSAMEHGGYLHRGFNNIDWLPKAHSQKP